MQSSHHTTQCGLLVFSPPLIYTSPLAFPIFAIYSYSLPVTAQPGNPTYSASLSIVHTALAQDSGSSPGPPRSSGAVGRPTWQFDHNDGEVSDGSPSPEQGLLLGSQESGEVEQ